MPERLKHRAQDIMSRDVSTLTRDASITDAVHLLAERGAPCAVVVGEEDRPEGIVTERDLLALARDNEDARLALMLKRMLQEEHHVFDSMKELRKAAATRVSDVMSSPVQCADVDMTVGQIAATMDTFDYRQLPVVREGRLVGLVTRQDIVRAIADKI